MKIIDRLFALEDKEYAKFRVRLIPGIKSDSVIGVPISECRNLAKLLYKSTDDDTVSEVQEFLKKLPHVYYDENILHGLIISEMKDYEVCVKSVDEFLPFVDNWAVLDIMSPWIFKKNKNALLMKIKEWSASSKVYTCLFRIEMLTSHFLDDDFSPDLLEIPAKIESEEDYVNNNIAFFFINALEKQWKSAISYIENKRLGVWVYNRTIQIAQESYRFTIEQKEYLKTLKR